MTETYKTRSDIIKTRESKSSSPSTIPPIFGRSPKEYTLNLRKIPEFGPEDNRASHMDELVAHLKAHPKITKLILSDNYVTADEAKKLAGISTLLTLDLSHNNDPTGIVIQTPSGPVSVSRSSSNEDVAVAIAESKSITHLNFSKNYLRAMGAQALAANIHLRELRLKDNVTFFGMTKVIEALSHTTTLEKLDLSYCNLTITEIEQISKTTSITYLVLAFNGLKDNSAKILSEKTHFYSLDLSGNEITDVGAAYFKGHPNLRRLNVSENNLGNNIGVEALATIPYLEFLNLASNNVIGNLAAKRLMRNKSILTLIMPEDSDISPEMKSELSTLAERNAELQGDIESEVIDILSNNNQLLLAPVAEMVVGYIDSFLIPYDKITFQQTEPVGNTLDLSGKQFSITDVIELFQFLNNNPEITRLILKNTNIDNILVIAIFSYNTTLKHLDVSFTKISDDGVEMLSSNNTLKSLNLSNTAISDTGVKHLLNNRSLRFVELPDDRISQSLKDSLKEQLIKNVPHVDNLAEIEATLSVEEFARINANSEEATDVEMQEDSQHEMEDAIQEEKLPQENEGATKISLIYRC